jgi:VWFA-related protein
MKNIGLVFSLAVAGVSMSTAAAQELPSAPSAVINKPKEQPAPPPQQPPEKPADIGPPADTEPAKPGATPKPATDNASSPPAAANEASDAPLFVARAEEVNVIFTVTDKRGRFIKDLKREDLKILDNQLPPERVSGFAAQTNLPLRVGMLIDASSSVRDRFKFEQEAANEFLHSIIRPKDDKAFVLSFDSTREVTAAMTNSTDSLAKGIRMIRPGGGTALFDAVYSACRDILMKQNDKVTTRRAIILLSDGDDNQSRVTREEAIEMAQRAEVIVYTISTDTSNSVNTQGEKILQRLSEATGGRHFRPFNLDDVSNAFTDIQDELRSQYAVAYKPANLVADGAFRSIDIETPNKKYKVRARKGYFAPKSN